jgi:hypothetical protein
MAEVRTDRRRSRTGLPKACSPWRAAGESFRGDDATPVYFLRGTLSVTPLLFVAAALLLATARHNSPGSVAITPSAMLNALLANGAEGTRAT